MDALNDFASDLSIIFEGTTPGCPARMAKLSHHRLLYSQGNPYHGLVLMYQKKGGEKQLLDYEIVTVDSFFHETNR